MGEENETQVYDTIPTSVVKKADHVLRFLKHTSR